MKINAGKTSNKDIFSNDILRNSINRRGDNLFSGITAGVLGGGADKLPIPDAAFSWLPFSIQKIGDVFQVDPSFNIQSRANITITATKYVDGVNGLDTNSGDDWDHAYKTPLKAYTSGPCRMYIAKGWYYRNQIWWDRYNGNYEIIGDLTRGVGDGVYFSADGGNQISGWSAEDAHYKTTYTGTEIGAAWDATNLDALGQHTALAKVADAATVNSTPNSWVVVAGVLHVNAFDGRFPDTDLHFYEGTSCIAINQDNRVLYAENINFFGGMPATVEAATAANGARFYAKNCNFAYASATNVFYAGLTEEVILQGCTVHGVSGAGDCINGLYAKIVEIDCDSYSSGFGASPQASSVYCDSVVVRINGKYHHTGGDCIADVGEGGAKSWNIACEMYNSGLAEGYDHGFSLIDASFAWLDSCEVHDCPVDLNYSTGATIYLRDFTGAAGVNDSGGTLVAY